MDADVNGVRLHYDIHGDAAGDPLLWISGFLGVGDDWRHLVEQPPAGFRLIAVDLRGHGASTGTDGPFLFRDAARDVLGLLDHLGLEGVKAIGLSGGGITLLHMATMAPASFCAMVVVSAPTQFPDETRAIQRRMSEAMLGDAEMARLRLRHAGGDAQVQRLLAQARGLADTPDDVRFTPEVLARVTADTLIVFGDCDPLYPVSEAHALHAGVPRSRLWIVPGGGHGPIFGEHRAAFVETALRFLREDR
jgi:pimeloyl-ACP methyl ester carboxylesterase